MGRAANVTIKEKKINTETMLKKAENINIYAVDSMVAGVGFVVDDGEIAMVTAGGYMRLNLEKAVTVAKEIIGIAEDIEYIDNFMRGDNNG